MVNSAYSPGLIRRRTHVSLSHKPLQACARISATQSWVLEMNQRAHTSMQQTVHHTESIQYSCENTGEEADVDGATPLHQKVLAHLLGEFDHSAVVGTTNPRSSFSKKKHAANFIQPHAKRRNRLEGKEKKRKAERDGLCLKFADTAALLSEYRPTCQACVPRM